MLLLKASAQYERQKMTAKRNEYPRPDLVRSQNTFLSLNGQWDFGLGEEGEYDRKINVPFVPESKASGVEEIFDEKTVRYRRTFTLPDGFSAKGRRVLLHIGACDWRATVRINGVTAGVHRGGYTPVELDITPLLKSGENTVSVDAFDDTANPLQPSGKQAADAPHGCFYTKCTGIWQSVWLESVPDAYIKRVKILPNTDEGKAEFTVTSSLPENISAQVFFKGKKVGEGSAKAEPVGNAACSEAAACFSITIENPVLWDVGCPNLYDVRLFCGEDSAETYFGMRSIKVDGKKLLLNGKPLFMRLVLDQGYFQNGIYTAENADEFARDIDLCLHAGFNGARMHMKVFEPAYICEADKKGFLLWGEYPNWGLDISRPEADGVMLPEWEEILRRDVNHPSIIGWCPFNEAFPGQNTDIMKKAVALTKSFDPTRLVIDTSGYVHSADTDIYDVHDYEQNPEVFASHYKSISSSDAYTDGFDGDIGYDGNKPYFVSEFGGAFFDADRLCENNSQESGNPWGYGAAPEDENEFVGRLAALCKILRDNPDICGFCYTQFTDVMQEMNGIFTFDRREKFSTEKIRKAVEG